MRQISSSLRDAARHFLKMAESRVIHSGWSQDRVAPINALKSACEDAADLSQSVELLVTDIVEQCVVVGRSLSQSVPYGSTSVSMDASEIELVSRSIEIEVESDGYLPVGFTREVQCPDTGLTTEVEFRLRSITPAVLPSSGYRVLYAASVAAVTC